MCRDSLKAKKTQQPCSVGLSEPSSRRAGLLCADCVCQDVTCNKQPRMQIETSEAVALIIQAQIFICSLEKPIEALKRFLRGINIRCVCFKDGSASLKQFLSVRRAEVPFHFHHQPSLKRWTSRHPNVSRLQETLQWKADTLLTVKISAPRCWGPAS